MSPQRRARPDLSQVAALRVARQRMTEALATGLPIVVPLLMHAAWEHMERSGGDALSSVHVGQVGGALPLRPLNGDRGLRPL
jgi:hypothetical protein